MNHLDRHVLIGAVQSTEGIPMTEETKTYPDQYLHVRNNKTGEEWIRPIGPRKQLALERLTREWAREEFGGELKLDGGITRKIDGDYYAKIMTDGRPPDSVVCWDGGGFYLETTYD